MMDSDGDEDARQTSNSLRSTAKLESGENHRIVSNHSKKKEEMTDQQQQIEENTVVYRLYRLTASNSTSPPEEELTTLRAFALKVAKDYIWHNEPFGLFYSLSDRHYYGRTNYGDNIQDEWLIVYILYEITKRFANLVARVIDSDGQFLLIEAADVLPKELRSWFESAENSEAENRVLIFRGALHIVPPTSDLQPLLPRSLSNDVDVFERLLRHDPGRLLAALDQSIVDDRLLAQSSVQRVIQNRIGIFPESVTSQLHRANCVLPAKFAAVLAKTGPFFLPAAVHLASLVGEGGKELRHHRESPPIADLITTSVTLSRCLYAKLLSYNVDVSLPQLPDWQLPNKDEFGYKANELGLKLTVGLQRLYSIGGKGGTGVEKSLDDTYNQYIGALQSLGYFEFTSDRGYNSDTLMTIAKLYCQMQQLSTNDQENHLKTVGKLFVNALRDIEETKADIKLRRESSSRLLQEEDDDAWLTITPDALDKLLAQKSSSFGKSQSPSTSSKSQSISNKGVLNGKCVVPMGDVAATSAKMIGNNSTQYSSEKNRRTQESATQSAKGINFDPDSFADSVKRMLDLQIPQDGDDSSDMDSYGEEDLDVELNEKGDGDYSMDVANKIKAFSTFMEQTSSRAANSTKPKNHAKNATSSRESKGKIAPPEQKKPLNSPGGDSIDFEVDDFTPVDIDNKLISDVLESYFPETRGQTASTSAMLHGDRLADQRSDQGQPADHGRASAK